MTVIKRIEIREWAIYQTFLVTLAPLIRLKTTTNANDSRTKGD